MPKLLDLHPLNIAFMGNFSIEKGSQVFAELVEQCRAEHLPITWWIFGGISDEKSLQKCQSFMKVKTTGFYTTSELPSLLATNHIDLGFILSIFPESYSKLSRECWKQELPLIYNRIGILDTLPSSNFGFAQLPHHLLGVVQLLNQFCQKPSLLEKEQQRIRRLLVNESVLSPNDKHQRYLKLYQQLQKEATQQPGLK